MTTPDFARPTTSEAIVVRNWAASWDDGEPMGKALLLVGPAALDWARAVATARGWDIVDAATLTPSMVEEALTTGSVGSARRAVLWSDADRLGQAGRRIARLVQSARWPVLLAATDASRVSREIRSQAFEVAAGGPHGPGPMDDATVPLDERLQAILGGREAPVSPGEYGSVGFKLTYKGEVVRAAEWDLWWVRYRAAGKRIEPYLLRVLRTKP